MSTSARFLPRFAALTALMCVGAFADTITLKTGEKIDGKIIHETDTEITVEVKVSATIKDETVVPKNTIEKIDKEQPDEAVWPTVKNIRLSTNSLPEAQYDALAGPLQGFINDFPKSAHVAEAKQILDTINAEKQRVEGGEVRFGQKWLSKEEVGKERYQIGGMLTMQYQRSQRSAGDLTGSLNTFELLEKNYPGSKSYPDGVETARETLATLKAGVDRAKQNLVTQLVEFNKGVAAASLQQKPELLAARQREIAQGDNAIAAAEKAKLKWPAIVTRSDKNLDYIGKKLPAEISRLARVDIAKLRQSIELATQAEKEIADKNAAAADSISKAITLWPTNELAKRLQPDAAALKASAAAAATPVPTAETTAAAAATPKATPVRLRTAPEPGTETAEKEKPFFLTVGGMITIALLLILGFAAFAAYKKIAGRANEIIE